MGFFRHSVKSVLATRLLQGEPCHRLRAAHDAPTTRKPRPGLLRRPRENPPVHPRLTSPGFERFGDGAGLGLGEQTECLRFHVRRSPRREQPASPDPSHLQAQGRRRAGSRASVSWHCQWASPSARSGDSRVVSTAS